MSFFYLLTQVTNLDPNSGCSQQKADTKDTMDSEASKVLRTRLLLKRGAAYCQVNSYGKAMEDYRY